MLEKPYILLQNGKKIKVQSIDLENTHQHDQEDRAATKIATITMNPKWLGYFNSQQTSIKAFFYKGLFTKSPEIALAEDQVAEFYLFENKLIVVQQIEGI